MYGMCVVDDFLGMTYGLSILNEGNFQAKREKSTIETTNTHHLILISVSNSLIIFSSRIVRSRSVSSKLITMDSG